MTNYTLHLGDCLESLRAMPDNSVDSVVCDPPYGLSDHKPEEVVACLSAWISGKPYEPKGKGFMGKSWDAWVPGPEVWRECLRVLKPGGHLLAFAGTRSMDLMCMSVRLAGFELRDSIGYAHDGGGAPLMAWAFGQGFPKSHNISKAIDKSAGVEREVVGVASYGDGHVQNSGESIGYGGCDPDADTRHITAPATDAAMQWHGWGTALKPAWEPVILARKPLVGTIADNVQEHGTGALNIDACRVTGGGVPVPFGNPTQADGWRLNRRETDWQPSEIGRWPANLIHDGSDEVRAAFPDSNGQQGDIKSHGKCRQSPHGIFGGMRPALDHKARDEEEKNASRFFYAAKASKRDRNEGCKEVLTWEYEGQSQEIHLALLQARDISEDITLLQDEKECSTTLFGNPAMGKSQQDLMFTISTVSRLITELKTLNFYQNSTTSASILDAIRTLKGSGSSLAESVVSINQLIQNITKGKTASALGAVAALLQTLSKISESAKLGNAHSTVKPTDLMAYLCRLVTPPGGVVLDPFMGSGSTGKAAIREGFRFVGCELDAGYMEIARARIEHELATQLAKQQAVSQPAQVDMFADLLS